MKMKDIKTAISRRQFIKKSSIVAGGTTTGLSYFAGCSNKVNSPESVSDEKDRLNDGFGNGDVYYSGASGMPQRILGNTGMSVSLLSFGGGSKFMTCDEEPALQILDNAVKAGVNYFDTSWDYGNGQSEVRFGKVLNNYRDQVYVATKLDARQGDAVKIQFEGCLERLQMDYVDVLLMHGICVDDVLATIESGVYSDLVKYKEQGAAKFIGFSVMQEADLFVAKSLIENLDIDVILGIINPVGRYGNCSYLLPLVNERGIGFLAMKVLRDIVSNKVTAKELISYALDKNGVSSAVIGHESMQELDENIKIVTEYDTSTGIAHNWRPLEDKVELYTRNHTPVWAQPWYKDGMIV